MLEHFGKLLTADVATLALLALVLAIGGPVFLVWVFREEIKGWLRRGKPREQRTDETARTMISREWLAEMGKLTATVQDHDRRIDRAERHVGNLDADFLGLRERSEELRNDVTKLNATVEGLCERVDEGRREAREDVKGIHARLDKLLERRAEPRT